MYNVGHMSMSNLLWVANGNRTASHKIESTKMTFLQHKIYYVSVSDTGHGGGVGMIVCHL